MYTAGTGKSIRKSDLGHQNIFNETLPAEMALNVAYIRGMISGAICLWDMHSQTGHGYKIDITVTALLGNPSKRVIQDIKTT